MEIVVVGSLALDTLETPWGAAEDCLGGSATYASVAASYFAPVRLVAVAGNDLDEEATRILRSRSVDLEGLEVAEGPTFRWGGRYHEDMNRRDTLFTELGVFESFHPQLPASYRDTPIVFLANIHPSLQLEVLDQVSTPQLTAMDTMNLWIETAREDLEKVLARIDILFLNDEELRQLTGDRILVRAVERLQAMGPRIVVVKKGEHGAVLFGPDVRFATPAMLLERVFDPTGAGDVFAGAFLGSLARAGRFDADAMRRAMIDGTVLASFVTEQFGMDRIVDLPAGDVAERVEELRELTRWPSGG